MRLRVASAARTGEWLARVLGLRPLAAGTWGVEPTSPLVVLREVPGARPVPQAGLLGIYHYAILLPARAELARFLRHLESLGEPWAASDHLVSEAIYLTDPDGIAVEVYADRPRAEWRHAGDSLEMAIDPLDRAGLLASAGPAPWEHAPAGTRVGHLHLFVGDLGAAERHYVRGVGFDVMTRRLRGALFVSAGGYHHHLGLNTWSAGSPVAGERDAGLDEWTLDLGPETELGSLSQRLEAAGITATSGHGSVSVTDPWGIRLRATAGTARSEAP